MLNQVTIHQLELFLVAAKLKNFTRAADQMAISQPAFSAQIIKLEKILGAPLFDRIDRRIEMTDVGSVFEQYAQKTISTLREGKQVVDDMTHKVIGALKIGASTTIANYVLPEYLAAYHRKYPDCKIEMIVNNTNKIEQALLKGEIDMGLVEGPIHNRKRVVSYLFRPDELVVIFSTGHHWKSRSSVSMKEFQQEPLIIRERGSGTRKVFTDMLGRTHAPLNIAMEIGNTEAIKKSAESGIGVAVVSVSAIKRELKEKTLKKARISGHPMKRRLSLILLHSKYLSNPLKAFIALLDSVEKTPDTGF